MIVRARGHGGRTVPCSPGAVRRDQRDDRQLSIVVGLLLAGLLLFVFRGPVGYVRSTVAWILSTRAHLLLWCVATSAAVVLLFALGFDWLRWIATIVFAALLATASIVAVDGRARHPSPEHDAWHRPLPARMMMSGRGVVVVAIATYLLVLPPLPNFVSNPLTGGAAALRHPPIALRSSVRPARACGRSRRPRDLRPPRTVRTEDW